MPNKMSHEFSSFDILPKLVEAALVKLDNGITKKVPLLTNRLENQICPKKLQEI